MKLVYNPGGFGASRQAQRYDAGHRGHRHRYTRGEKLAILGVLDKLMIDEGMTQVRAGAVLKADPACLTRCIRSGIMCWEMYSQFKILLYVHMGTVR